MEKRRNSEVTQDNEVSNNLMVPSKGGLYRIVGVMIAAIILLATSFFQISLHHPLLDKAATELVGSYAGLGAILGGKAKSLQEIEKMKKEAAEGASEAMELTKTWASIPRFGFPQVLIPVAAALLLAQFLIGQYRFLGKSLFFFLVSVLASVVFCAFRFNNQLSRIAQTLGDEPGSVTVSPIWLLVVLGLGCVGMFAASTAVIRKESSDEVEALLPQVDKIPFDSLDDPGDVVGRKAYNSTTKAFIGQIVAFDQENRTCTVKPDIGQEFNISSSDILISES